MSDLNVSLPSGGSMPLIGLGTWQMRGRTCYEAVRHALDVGYRHIDTATMYGNQAEVGRALADSGVPRGDVFVTTKLPPRNVGRERQTIEASLRALGTDYVDLWLIHWPPKRRAELRERDVVLEGYSPFRASRLDDPVLVEIGSDHDVTSAQVIVRWHLDHGFVVIPKSARPERIDANFDVFGFSLDEDELARIDALGRP